MARHGDIDMISRFQPRILSLGTVFLDFPAPDLPVSAPPASHATQFTVNCTGKTHYPEDDPIFGTYEIEETVNLGECTSISDAIAFAEARMASDDIGPDHDDAVSFSPGLVRVVDGDQRLVLAGEVWGAGIRWCMPVTSDDEARQVADDASRLHAEACFEAGWDNYCTARRLRFQASVLEGRLVDPFWRAAARAALTTAA